MSLGSVTMTVTEPWIDEARQATARRAAMKRATKNRVRGKGHPTTGPIDYSPIDYSPDEWEFISAIQAFKDRPRPGTGTAQTRSQSPWVRLGTGSERSDVPVPLHALYRPPHPD
jgi:hypothetical protein